MGLPILTTFSSAFSWIWKVIACSLNVYLWPLPPNVSKNRYFLKEDNLVKISVAMITYNHEAYIEQALNSVLEQQLDFEYEIVIGDDVSTDRTRSILWDFKGKYPQRIHLLLHEKHLGAGGNVRE